MIQSLNRTNPSQGEGKTQKVKESFKNEEEQRQSKAEEAFGSAQEHLDGVIKIIPRQNHSKAKSFHVDKDLGSISQSIRGEGSQEKVGGYW